ncbi:MAG: histidine phosphatase family protein [Campylobacteraceae bacterium]|nr:histidine phosphatase family protein [Campylobacteraceae bacterium]
MKKIYLIRHAKSSWKEEGISDFQRQLNKKGKVDLTHMAKRLKNFHVTADLIISSPAKRAKTTAKEIANTIGFEKSNILYQDCLYESSYEAYRYLLDTIDDRFNSIFIIAHNPTITQVGEILSGAILTNMPTCSIVCLEFDIQSFRDISENSGKILFFDYPKKHNFIYT